MSSKPSRPLTLLGMLFSLSLFRWESFSDPFFLSATRCDLRVVSDANQFFIDTILKHHGLLECFKEINTNPSIVDEEGRLRIFPCHDFTTRSHGCSICPPNMCKVVMVKHDCVMRNLLPSQYNNYVLTFIMMILSSVG